MRVVAASSSTSVQQDTRLSLHTSTTYNETDATRRSQLYSLLDHPRHAIKLTCLDARKLHLLSSSGGLRLFSHKKRPTVYVHLTGRVVGIEEKEKKVAWLVDDGSAVIAVHHFFRQAASDVSKQNHIRPSRKGKERQGGIPSQYLLPPPPPLPSAAESFTNSKSEKAPINASDMFEIGDLVSVIGRVELWVDRRERIVIVDRVMQAKDRPVEYEGCIEAIMDPNIEPRHLLEALHLSATVYSTSFQLPGTHTAEEKEWVPVKLREMPDMVAKAQEVPLYSNKHTIEVQRRPLRVMEDLSEVKNSGARKRCLGLNRRILPERSSKREKTDDTSKPQQKVIRTPQKAEKGALVAEVDIPSSQLSITSVKTTATPRHRRQLRSYVKLSDSKMTESTFRVYVEKHIVDFCSELPLQFQATIDITPKATRKRRLDIGNNTNAVPPAFTLSYLLQVADLRGHAMRTVEVATKRREERRKRQAVTSTKTKVKATFGSENAAEKMKRLYMSVLQAMLMDGIVVLALPTMKIYPPFNGKSLSRARKDEGQNNFDTISLLSSSPSCSSSSSSASDTEQEYRRAPMQEDAYQLVTPALLMKPILETSSRSAHHTLSSVQITQKMQAMDERWRFIRYESVQEGMQLLRENVV